jgi:hypothetical protein
MDSEYIQQVRYKLQKRQKRINTAGFQTFHSTLLQTWGFLQENQLTKGILDDLERRFPDGGQHADKMMAGEALIGNTESEHNAICYWVVKKCVEAGKPQIEFQIGRQVGGASQLDDAVEAFRLTYLEPLFDYIDEQIDDKRTMLVLLKKFKHRCEWFRRAAMFARFKEDTGQGEKELARNLYEYLHDQGLQFHIEPESASGRVDLISAQSGKDRLVADTKLFNPERGQDRGYIIKGFRQVYDYLKDFNESFGYLVIFKTCQQDLAIPTQLQESSVPFVTHNNKTIFLVVIDIFDYPESASKRGKLQAYEITPHEFVDSLREAESPPPG